MPQGVPSEPHGDEADLSATALWYDGAGGGALRADHLPRRATGQVRVRSLFGALSRGTERLVFQGSVPESEFERMQCPHQQGSFSGPVKYGYQTVGEIVAGPEGRIGERVFVLHPHQNVFDVPEADAVAIPENVPSQRAVLSANMETALNVVWDSGVSAGDRVLVVGAGVVGALVARIAAQIPGTSVVLCDINENASGRAASLGVEFAAPAALSAFPRFDAGINTSGVAAGLQTAIDHAGAEARIVEASWYGAGEARLSLGGAFHSQRLSIRSSQVGRIPPERAPRWTHRRRLETAIRLVEDPAFDILLAEPVDFAELPAMLPRMLGTSEGPPCPLIRYPAF
jgi:hypothetical protein